MNTSTHRSIWHFFIICLISLGTLSSYTAQGQVVQSEIDALEAFYASTGGASWTNDTNWGTGDPSTWFGVTVVGTHVTKVHLRNNNLIGTIPDAFYALPSLQSLHLRDNQLSGTVSSLIGTFTNLTFLALQDNDLSGTLPTEFSSLTSLRELWAQGNDFSGAIPSGFASMTAMQYLAISENDLTGLPDLSALTSLKELYVRNNKFEFDDLETNVGVPSSKHVYTPQAKVGTATAVAATLGGTETLTVSVGGSANSYKWYKDNVLLSGETSITLTLTNIQASDDGVYVCKITNTNLPLLTLTSEDFTVSVPDGPEIPDWYITTTAAGRNRIIVDQPAVTSPTVDYAFVYVETFNTGVFEYEVISPTSIDFTDAGDSNDDNWQQDETTFGSAKATKYKIRTRDANNVLSELSDMQQSVHLSISAGHGTQRNLYWTHYLGQTVLYYNVYASDTDSDLGTELGDGVLLASLPSTDNTFTDLSAAGYVYYMIAAVLEAPPTPLKGGELRISNSNIFSTEVDIINTIIPTLKVYPNPVSEVARIEFDNPANKEYTFRVMDITGKVLREQNNITGTELEFRREDLPLGIYIIQLVGDISITNRIVIN